MTRKIADSASCVSATMSASTPIKPPQKPSLLHAEFTYNGSVPHPDDIKEPEIGVQVDAYIVVSVGQAVGVFYSW